MIVFRRVAVDGRRRSRENLKSWSWPFGPPSVRCDLLRFAINPYEASPIDDRQEVSEATGGRGLAIAWSLAFFYPLIAVAFVYLYWGLAWVLLGHRPRPSVDDPKDIGVAIDFVYNIGILLVVLLPPMSVGSLVCAILCPIRSLRERRFGRLMLAIANAFIFYCVWKLVKFDPGHVFEWFFD